MKSPKEYLNWYRETRCQYRSEDGKQCQQAQEIMVDKNTPLQEVPLLRSMDGRILKSTLQHSTFRSNYCYYHNKKREGRFDNFTRQA